MKHAAIIRIGAVVTAVLIGAGGLAACAGGTPDPDDTSAAGGTLAVGTLTDLTKPDGHILGAGAYPFLANVFDTLVEYDEDMAPQPSLATDWELADDGLTLTLTLRDDVTFHNGKEFTSADIKPNLDRVQSPELGNPQLGLLSKNVSAVETPDGTTAVLTLATPSAGIMDLLALMAVVDVDEAGEDGAPIGTGPFVFDSWKPGQGFTMLKYDDYWGDPALLDEVDVDVFGDSQTLSVQLEAGAVDVALGLDNRTVSRYADGSDYPVNLSGPAGGYYIALDTTKAPFDTIEARQALAYSIDRDRFGTDVLFGIGTPSPIPWGEESTAYDEKQSAAYPFDLDKAEGLFDEAGLAGATIPLTVSASTPDLVAQATILQADLAKIGITLDVRTVEFAQWRELVTTASFEGAISGQYSYNFLSPGSLPLMALPFRADGNASSFSTPEYSELVAAINVPKEPQEAAETFHEYTQYLLDQAFLIDLSLLRSSMVTRTGVEGAGFFLASYVDFAQASVS